MASRDKHPGRYFGNLTEGCDATCSMSAQPRDSCLTRRGPCWRNIGDRTRAFKWSALASRVGTVDSTGEDARPTSRPRTFR